MMTAPFAMLAYLRAFLIARHRLAVEAVALRQQLAVYKRKQPRPKLNRFDRLFWVLVRRIWNNWSEALILVKPDCRIRLLTVPTLWFRTLYRFFAIEHDRRRILPFNVTFHPTSDWIVQQLREAFPLRVLIDSFCSTLPPSSGTRCCSS